MVASTYDAVPYPHLPHRASRPDRLELAGRLLGLSPPPAARARVLEIGCATGGNVLPMAALFPEARFVALDIADSQIDVAKDLAQEAGLGNVDLRAMDLSDLGPGDGQFDYIIAHGVYSWVDDAVKARLLDVCGQRLAPDGVAFVSHNVKPGWYARAAARGMMLYHTQTGELGPPAERIEQAKALLSFLAAGARPSDRLYKAEVASQLEHVGGLPDEIFFHDYLADVNDACFFHEFAAELPGRGLQYLADGELPSMFGTGFAPEVLRALEGLGGDVIRREQYLDFLKNRAFRMTLLCRADRELTRRFAASQLATLRFASRAEAEAGAELGDGSAVAFRTPNAMARIASPVTKGVLARLGRAWPKTYSFEELVGGRQDAVKGLAADLMTLFSCDLVELALGDHDVFAAAPSERPRATALARAQAARGLTVANLRHEAPGLDDDERRLLPLLDGRARADLPEEGLGATLERLARKALLLA